MPAKTLRRRQMMPAGDLLELIYMELSVSRELAGKDRPEAAFARLCDAVELVVDLVDRDMSARGAATEPGA